MAKDPAFLYYDGDAARDVSHMNRLERGCYFDLIQAQRKFGGYTVEQARKILGKDFDECWPALEMILTLGADGKYFIEWVANSHKKRAEHAEKQRERIQNYWDKKKETEIPDNNDGNTVVLPLVNENAIVNENDTVVKKEKKNAQPKKILFRDSQYFDKEKLKTALWGTQYQDANIDYYHETILNWSDGKGEKRIDWLATARTFMSGDTEKGKFKDNTYKHIPKNGTHQQSVTNGHRTNHSQQSGFSILADDTKAEFEELQRRRGQDFSG